MKRILPLLLLCAAANAAEPAQPAADPATTNAPALAAVDSPAWVAKLPAATNATQLLVVAGIGMDKTTAYVSMHEKGAPGRGSAIFLHCFGPQKPWTGGCVAVPKDVMLRVMRSVRADCVVVIGTFEGLGASW